jgi:hypothetical protein
MKCAPNIKVICSWFKGDQSGKELFESRTYRRLTAEERKHHKGAYSASIVFFTPRMILNDDGVTYSINPFDALDMAEKYENYNFEERNSEKTVGEKRPHVASEEDGSDDENMAYAPTTDGS